MSDVISVIIPIHNGEKYIIKLIKSLMKQTYSNIEIILVENNSEDSSLMLCNKMSQKYKNVTTLISEEKGTSYARKLGILNSTGKYIVFMDQDDSYFNCNAIKEMYYAIEEDQVQICQFSFYKNYFGAFKCRIPRTANKRIYDRTELFEDEIKGILGIKGSSFSTTVWSKIYDGNMLRNIAPSINESILFAEDVYLNIYAFFNDFLTKVSVRNEAYYCWKLGIGLSSTIHSGKILFDDYKIVKPLALEMLKKYGCKEEMIYACLSESIWFHRFLVNEMILEKTPRDNVEERIKAMGDTFYIKQAKEYFSKQKLKKIEGDFLFLVSDYTSKEYYDWFMKHIEKHSLKTKIFTNLLLKFRR